MRIDCPFCGEREAQEFITLGQAMGPRPDPSSADALEAFHDYVHLRDNPRGAGTEYWYHAAGCRSWLRVTRDTVTHQVTAAELVAP